MGPRDDDAAAGDTPLHVRTPTVMRRRPLTTLGDHPAERAVGTPDSTPAVAVRILTAARRLAPRASSATLRPLEGEYSFAAVSSSRNASSASPVLLVLGTRAEETFETVVLDDPSEDSCSLPCRLLSGS